MTKIKVEADISSVEAELNKIKQSLASVNAQMSGGNKISGSAAKKELEAMVKRADALAAALERVNKTGALHSKQASDAAKAYEQMARTTSRLERTSGERNGWASSWMRESGGDARTRAALARVNPPAHQNSSNQFSRMAQGIGTVAGAAIGGGGVGSIIGSAVGGFIGGPIGSAILGAIGGKLDKGYGDAKQSAVIFSDARKAMGGLGADFFKLRDTVQGLNSGLGITHIEAAQLAKQFIKTGNVTADNADDVGQSLKTAVGFSRSYGLDPSQGAQFFGTMRQNGVTRSEGDNRRLALMIGESVAKGGNTAKMDEVLSSVASFVSSSSRTTLSEANVGGYLSMLNSLTGTGLTGLKNSPENAAAMMASADQSVRGGGAMGEGSRNFLYRALQAQNPDMTSLDLDNMLNQGIFGNARKAFGKNSPLSKGAKELGDQSSAMHYQSLANGSKGSNLKAIMKALERESGGNIDMMTRNMRGVFGGSLSDNAAFFTGYRSDSGLGSLEKKLKAAGVDPEAIKINQMGAMAGVAMGDKDNLKTQWKKLQGMNMSKEDVASVNGSLANDDAFRNAIIKMTAKYDTDPGEKLRQNQADMADGIQELVEKLIPVENAIKDGIIELVRYLAPQSNWGKMMTERSHKDHAGDIIEEAKADPWKANILNEYAAVEGESARHNYLRDLRRKIAHTPNAYNKKFKDEFDGKFDFADKLDDYAGNTYLQGYKPGQSEAEEKPSLDLTSHLPKTVAPASGSYKEQVVAEAKRQGIPDDKIPPLLSLVNHESNFNPKALGPIITKGMHKGDRAAGQFQYMEKSSQGWDRFNNAENITHGVADFKKNLDKFGAVELAIAAHQTGSANKELLAGRIPGTHDGNQSTSDYVSDIMQGASAFSVDKMSGQQRKPDRDQQRKPERDQPDKNFNFNDYVSDIMQGASSYSKDQMPAQQRKPDRAQSDKNFNFNGMFTLKDMFGREAAEPVSFNTSFGAPRPAGT